MPRQLAVLKVSLAKPWGQRGSLARPRAFGVRVAPQSPFGYTRLVFWVRWLGPLRQGRRGVSPKFRRRNSVCACVATFGGLARWPETLPRCLRESACPKAFEPVPALITPGFRRRNFGGSPEAWPCVSLWRMWGLAA